MPRKPVDPKEKHRNAGISLPPPVIAAVRSVANKKDQSLGRFVGEVLLTHPDVRAALKKLGFKIEKKRQPARRPVARLELRKAA